ncbi:MAG: protein kinase [Woeseia sp.]|nr:protein kinase [Woeseia sp.]MBT8095530.1 protein kinase [Woeseia sp.]NNE59862.1 protein kinase [Woeseia sp.]NNL55855.1 protein kinase [Woeseia sp.]
MAGNVTPITQPHAVPAKIGKYVIINKVGQGSTGSVFLSHDPYYRRDVAIKVYNIEEDANADQARVSRKMFFNEAHMVGMLQHPNIMPIYDAGEENGSYYVVTEHVQGARTLAAYCRPDNLLRIDDVVEIIFKCAKALNYAHGRGVIHRDIKPSNIMLTIDNDVRIIDFGIAICNDSDASQIEGIAGSPSYMSPEQVQSEELTSRSDIYSLGAVLYELLTGFRPFRADSLSKLLHQIVYATPPPIHTYREDLSEELEQVVAMTMQKDPAKRCVSGNALAADLTRVYQELRTKYQSLDNQEHFDLLRSLNFFHDFSHAEIWEVLRASDWREYKDGDDIVREGEMDDRFYIIVAGEAAVEANGKQRGSLTNGDCFGETSYVSGAKRTASIRAKGPVTILRVSSTLLEQASSSCQLRFNKVFLRALITRLQGIERAKVSQN